MDDLKLRLQQILSGTYQRIKPVVRQGMGVIPPVNAYRSVKRIIQGPKFQQGVQGVKQTPAKEYFLPTSSYFKQNFNKAIGVLSPLEVGVAAAFRKENKPYSVKLKEEFNRGGDIPAALESRGWSPYAALPVGLGLSIALPGAGEIKTIKYTKGAKNLNIVRETAERIFKESGKTKSTLRGLMGESFAQTKFRRNLGLKPEDVYQTSQDIKQQFRAFSRVTPTNLIYNANNLQDITPTEKGFKDVYRIFEKVFKQEYPKIKQNILDPFDEGKKYYVKMIDAYSQGLKKSVIDQGIKKGSRESAAVQLFGEGKLPWNELVKTFGKQKAEIIKNADGWFRRTYDELLDTVNTSRRQLYPNSPEMIIPHRQDYYRHFKELNGVTGLKNIFENPAGIDPLLVGISDYTLPRTKWLSFAQKRLTDTTDYDAVGGFVDYLPKAAFSSQIDPSVLMLRKLTSEVVQKTGQEGAEEYKKLNNFIEFLEDYANDLSGKTNPLDRGIQKYIPGGRKTFRLIDWVNKRVKANTILGNASSSIAQIFNVPQGIASAGERNFLAGLYETVLSPLKTKKAIDESGFIAERYLDTMRFDEGILNKAKKFAVWMTQSLDEFGTKAIWNAHYKKALVENIPSPIKHADDLARKLVAGRGIGEVPLVQKSKLFQVVAPFQLEVSNLWHVMKDMVDARQFGKLAKLLFYNYLFNSAAEPIVGRRITLDPIDAVIDAVSDEDINSPTLMGGRVAGEVLSNIPMGQTLASMYPEYGFNLGNKQMPTRQQLFGEGDPTRYGSGLLAVKGLQDPLYKLIPPFGGGQLKKTIQGIQAAGKGYAETKGGQVQYPIQQTPRNYLQSAVFGKNTIPAAREYYKNDRRPLSDTQSNFFKQAQDKIQTYQKIQEGREMKALEEKQREIVRATTTSSFFNGKHFYYDENADEVKAINTEFQPVKPKLSGAGGLDSELVSAYKSDLTKKEAVVKEMFSQNLISSEEASKELAQLKIDGLNIDIESQNLQPPTLTGVSSLDKKILKDYKSLLTKRENLIFELYQMGQMSVEQATSELKKIEAVRGIVSATTSSGQKVKNLKLPTIKSLKFSKPVTIKIKSIPKGNIWIRQPGKNVFAKISKNTTGEKQYTPKLNLPNFGFTKLV